MLGFYLKQSAHSQFFTPYSLLEEAAYTFTSANNYLRFGYLNSGFLQDFATGLDPADHPYVYNHMPPGPDLLTSVVLSLSDRNYVWARAFFASTMLAGLAVYYLFLRKFFSNLGAGLPAVALLLISPWVITQLFDRQIYSPFLLLAFLPPLLLFRYLEKYNTSYLIAAAAVIVLSSIYIEYSLLSAIIVSWIFMYLMQLMPLRLRHMIVVCAAFGFGIVAHLVQNMLYLGWDIFVTELKYTIYNRVTGYPTQQALAEYSIIRLAFFITGRIQLSLPR